MAIVNKLSGSNTQKDKNFVSFMFGLNGFETIIMTLRIFPFLYFNVWTFRYDLITFERVILYCRKKKKKQRIIRNNTKNKTKTMADY